jgi:hypothetical protein
MKYFGDLSLKLIIHISIVIKHKETKLISANNGILYGSFS